LRAVVSLAGVAPEEGSGRFGGLSGFLWTRHCCRGISLIRSRAKNAGVCKPAEIKVKVEVKVKTGERN
jgi:hypothetical protein